MINIQNLTKEYQTDNLVTKVLKGISLNIDQGEFVAIMGPSGSGKSTLMHILGFLIKPSSGNYFFEKQNVAQLDDSELAYLRNKKAGFVFQSFNLLPRTTVLENVKLPLVYTNDNESTTNSHELNNLSNKLKNKRAEEVLNRVGLGHRLHHYSNQLSGGEQQRVAIARALINNPEIIFADEPTGNLDSKSGEQILQIFESLNKKGHTVILVTHESDIAAKAKRIMRMKDGFVSL
ncbi:ABC transporter ATP-binding protein [Patescibacteria group bacterium]|nr:ABC transporter ATP-binding protein [Patescibacteria group bacterium]MBU2474871.1 ABC transporter ATP-binding protein [Patescibacteria group bacterium]